MGGGAKKERREKRRGDGGERETDLRRGDRETPLAVSSRWKRPGGRRRRRPSERSGGGGGGISRVFPFLLPFCASLGWGGADPVLIKRRVIAEGVKLILSNVQQQHKKKRAS